MGVGIGLDRLPVARTARRAHQVGVVAAQVHARDGADAVFFRHRAGEPVRGDSHPHAALHQRTRLPAPDFQHWFPA